MIRAMPLLHRLRRDSRGISAVEFAILSMPLFLAILGGIELGYRMMMISLMEAKLKTATRMATTGTYTGAQIDTFVTNELSAIGGGTVTIFKSNYQKYSQVRKPEKITSDTPPVGAYNPGDCYQDLNGNNQWDADGGKGGLGGADDVIDFKVNVAYPTLFPFAATVMGIGNTTTISTSTVMQNEPYAATPAYAVPTRCS